MSERGFIAVDRGIFDHPIFADEPMTEREAWLWLIANACWKPTQKRIGSAVLNLSRGQVGCSLRFLAKAWRWTDSRVRRFLAKLQSAQMIDAQATQQATQITICNFDTYQSSRRTDEAETDAVATQTITRKQSSSEAKASSPPSKRGTRIDGFEPDLSVGVEIGLSPEQSHREAQKFRDWALAAPGQKGVKLDWTAAWRNWARRAFDDLPKYPNGGARNEPGKPHSARPSFNDGLRQGVRSGLAGRRVSEPVPQGDPGSGPEWSGHERPDRLASGTVTLERGEDGAYSDREQHPRRYGGPRH